MIHFFFHLGVSLSDTTVPLEGQPIQIIVKKTWGFKCFRLELESFQGISKNWFNNGVEGLTKGTRLKTG